jgi:hypothetical protein
VQRRAGLAADTTCMVVVWEEEQELRGTAPCSSVSPALGALNEGFRIQWLLHKDELLWPEKWNDLEGAFE